MTDNRRPMLDSNTSGTVRKLLVILAMVFFLLAAFSYPTPFVEPIAFGLFLYMLSQLI